MRTPSQKIVLYSHDTLGLGHMRRNLAIAQALIEAKPDAAILIIAGAHEVGAFEIPSGVDCLTLPALAKDKSGQYQPRSLAVSRQDLMALRAKTILTAVQTFQPDVFIADKVPSGAFGELIPALKWLRAQKHTRRILGLRDVLDEPEAVRREWSAGAYEAVVDAYYNAVWVYGDPRLYDPVFEYGFSHDFVAKTRFTGYLGRPTSTDRGHRMEDLPDLPASKKLILCTVGGGQDGEQVARTFLEATLPPDAVGVLVTGPFMPVQVREALQARVSLNPQFHLLVFVREPEKLMQRADRVIAMGGYNVISEILSYQKPALIVPRVSPRTEQLIRAERFAQAGLLDYLHPSQLTANALTEWLANDANLAQRDYSRVDLNGLERLPRLLDDVLKETPRRPTILSRARYEIAPRYVG